MRLTALIFCVAIFATACGNDISKSGKICSATCNEMEGRSCPGNTFCSAGNFLDPEGFCNGKWQLQH